jgi:hypothetical protein
MEDTENKIRRNLVALSALIILAPLLDLRLKDQASLLGLADISKINETKMLVCAAVVLVYFFLRYIFDEGIEKKKEGLSAALLKNKQKAVLNSVLAELKKYLKSGKTPRHIKNYEDYGAHLFEGEVVNQRDQFASIKLDGYIDANQNDPWENKISVNFYARHKIRGQISSSGGLACEYQFTKLSRARLSIFPLIKTAFYTPSGINFVFPFLLFYVAWLVCCFSLTRAMIGY